MNCENNNNGKNNYIMDENPDVQGYEKLPVKDSLRILRYRTIKKNLTLGWWSVVVLLEDHNRKQICFYRWKRRNDEWKRDKKITFRSHGDWIAFKSAVESFLKELPK